MTLALLGPRLTSRFSVTGPGGPIPIRIASRKARALLYFTAVQPQHGVTRDELATLLWCERVDSLARQSLRQCLVSLRRDLAPLAPELLILSGDVIKLRDECLTVDALEFAKLKADGEASDFKRAVNLYRGEFLAGNNVQEPPFVDWVRQQRDRFQGIAAHLFERHAEMLNREGNGEQAVNVAKRLVALDPLREDWQRRLLELCGRYGGRDAAVAQAKALTRFLRTELGVEPSAPTKALIADIERLPIAPASWRPSDHSAPSATASARQRPPFLPPMATKPSLLVRPFINLSSEGDPEYFAEGLAADVIAALSCIRSISVIVREPGIVSRKGTVKVAQVNREIEADYVLKGSVRRFGKNVRITAELMDAASGANVLGQRYDRQLHDVLAVQDELAGRIASSIELQIYAAEATRFARQAPHTMDARACLMRAISLINIRSSRNYASAQALLKRAIELDPDCTQAYSLSAYVMALEVVYGWRPRENTMAAALDAARNAILLDPDAAWGHLALGYAHAQSRSTEDAIRNYEKALVLNPNFALAHTYLGSAYSVLGKSEAALAQIDTAERLTSREMFCGVNNYVRANAHFAAGRYHDASICARNSVRESPGIVTSHRHVVVNCALSGAVPEARTALKDLSRLVPGISLRSINEALPYVREHDRNRFLDAFYSLGLD